MGLRRRKHDEFGNLSETGEAGFKNEVKFTGSVQDSSSGLDYMNSRYYNLTTGRFLTQDSYTGNAYDPWTQHLYAYCGNNPTSMIDPTGHDFWSDIGNFFSGIGKAIKKAAEDTWSAVKKAAETTWKAVKKAAEDTWSAVKTAAVDTWNAISSAAVSTYNWVANTNKTTGGNKTKKSGGGSKKTSGNSTKNKNKDNTEANMTLSTPIHGLNPNDWNHVSDNTWRWGNSNGDADYDIDVNGKDDHGVEFPHQHDWDLNNKDKPRGMRKN